MMKCSRKYVALAVALVLAAVTGVIYLYRSIVPASSGELSGHSERAGSYYTVIDDAGNTIFTTGHMVFPGDEYIDEEDTKYTIVEVSGDKAIARTAGKMEVLPPFVPVSAAGAAKGGAVGIYHTHSAESYIPSDGTDSVPGHGGVFKVGSAMAEQLGKLGIKAIHDTTSHDPNDARAYDRSRRTATSLLKQQKPLAIFDVHRDAGPAEPYLKEINGKDVAKCMIVIGRQNPKMQSNLEFARRLKDEVNSKYSGLIKGIFMGKADFNQDIFDRALLLEMGSEQTSREAAERGISIVASVLPNVLPASGPGAGPESRGAGRTIG
ncbi:MAG TPA: stage II sporulation protein P, partial [Firmicutes bacterium]|nr:stage II sporulation protein P [Bacillota bacterium]